MLQMEFKPNWACGFNLRLKEMLFESVVDTLQTTMDNCLPYYPISSRSAFGSGELKSIKSVQSNMINISLKS